MVPDRGPATSAVTIVMVVTATVFVAARFATRFFLVKSLKQDDWWILGAWILAVAFSLSICLGVKFGLGLHRVDIPTSNFPALRKLEYAFSVLYNPCLMLTKTSIVVFYLSVMSRDVDPVFKWCNWLCLAVANVAGLALTFLNIFQCNPVSAGYAYPTPDGAKCTDVVTLYLSSAPVNIITDIAILFLPMPILTGMRLPKKQKIILVVTFGAGAFVAAVDVVRIAYLQNAALNRLKVVNTGTGAGTRIQEENDFSWYASLSFMWSAVEVNIGIICACVPSLKPLFLRFLPRFIKDADDASLSSNMDLDVQQTNPPPPKADSATFLTNPAAFRRPSTREYTGDDDGDSIGFLNMLAGPDDDAPPLPNPRRTTTRVTKITTNQSVTSDFDFVNMTKSRNMLKLSNRQSLWPVAVVTIIFFLWGFAYGLLDTLNAQFQKVGKLTTSQTLGLHAAYFGAYLVGPLTLGRFILSRYGFKAVMITGLCVYGCGTLVFWPSAVLTSYTAFVISNFIVGFGLSCLEIAANPYCALCGPLEYAEVRLSLSQAFQAVGTVCSPLLARKVLFKNVFNAPSLVDVQWAYLGISLFVFVLAGVFYYIPLPEATDEQLEEQADKRSAVYRAHVGPYRVVWVTLALGVFCQWWYVGAQEGIGNQAQSLATLLRPHSTLEPADYQTIAHTMFAVGRFLAAFMNYLIKPRWVLLLSFVGVIITSALQMDANGTAGLAVLMCTFFFEAGIFSIVYAISMRGMGAQTKNASALMTAAISGGAVIPFVQWAASNARGVKYSYCVVLAAFACGSIFPLYLNFVPAARNQVDPIHETRRDRRARRQFRNDSAPSDADAPSRQFGLLGILARRKKRRSDVPTFQHVERASQPSSPMTMVNSERKQSDTVSVPGPLHQREPSRHVTELAPWKTLDGSDRSIAASSGKSGSLKEPPPQEVRDWTEEDEIIEDYHKALRGI